MASSKQEAERVAQEKERASRAMGHSAEKAKRYGDEVRDYARRERAREQGAK